jgi:arsenical pump membrane protein
MVSRWPVFRGDLTGAFGVALISNLINNLPIGLIGANALELAHIPAPMKNAFLIGVALGPNLSVTGSLATILWLINLRKEGFRLTAWTFLKFGILVMPLAGCRGTRPGLVFLSALARTSVCGVLLHL